MLRKDLLLLPYLLCGALLAQGPGPARDAEDRIARLHDVGKLLPGNDTAREAPRDALSSLASAVRFLMQPALRADEELQTLGERWLVLLGRAEQHAWLEQVTLGELAAAMPLGQLQVQVVTFPAAQFAMHVLPALQGGDAPREVMVLEPGEATEAFVKAVLARKDAEAMELEPVAMTAMRMASATKLYQTAYVRDFAIEANPRSMVADPVIDVIHDGISVQAMATRREDGSLALSLNASLAELHRPIPTFTTSLGVGKPVTIQLPSVTRVKVEAKVELLPGQMVAIVMPKIAGKQSLLLVRIGAAAGAPSGKLR
jgi:hypothetical protein